MCGKTPLCVSDHHPGPATKQTREKKCEREEYLADYCEKNKIERSPGDPCPHLYWYPAVLGWKEQFVVAKKENARRKKLKATASANNDENNQHNCNNGKKNGRANGKSNGKSQARQAKRRRERRANKNGVLMR
jgi:hypothetical protein